MKKINNLEELTDLIGIESVEKCFTEYILNIIAKAHRWDELQNDNEVHTSKYPEFDNAELIEAIEELSEDEAEQVSRFISKIKIKGKK